MSVCVSCYFQSWYGTGQPTTLTDVVIIDAEDDFALHYVVIEYDWCVNGTINRMPGVG